MLRTVLTVIYFSLNRGETDVVKNCIELNSQPVGMERLNKTIYVGCMDDTLKCFTSKVGLNIQTSLIFF